MNAGKQPTTIDALVCPVPLHSTDRILLGHGSGGRLTRDLVKDLFLRTFSNPVLETGDDAAAVIPPEGCSLAISTDSHVVKPLIFPGGDIGRLAVCGTVNDVSMLGAIPRYLTAGFIIEEGFELSILERIVLSMQTAADEAGIEIAAGDTKVIEKGSGDGVYITTTGLGWIRGNIDIHGSNAVPGDAVILSGPVGDHGIAVLSARGELGLAADIQSDVAPLNHMVQGMLDAVDEIHVLRDPTRGGLATTLNEIAEQSGVGIQLEETAIPVRNSVRAACEVLGFDPLYLANEGKLIVIAPPENAEKLLSAMRNCRYGAEATLIGSVIARPPGRVIMRSAYGTNRVLDILSGEMLPRIC